jgi:putative membrane protein
MHTLAQVSAGMDSWGHMGGWGGGWMWLWGTLMMLFWVAVIAAVWRSTQRRDRASGGEASRARDILDERYAGGELSTEEYRERLDHLR